MQYRQSLRQERQRRQSCSAGATWRWRTRRESRGGSHHLALSTKGANPAAKLASSSLEDQLLNVKTKETSWRARSVSRRNVSITFATNPTPIDFQRKLVGVDPMRVCSIIAVEDIRQRLLSKGSGRTDVLGALSPRVTWSYFVFEYMPCFGVAWPGTGQTACLQRALAEMRTSPCVATCRGTLGCRQSFQSGDIALLGDLHGAFQAMGTKLC